MEVERSTTEFSSDLADRDHRHLISKSTMGSSQSTLRFLEFPREIRNQIYVQCLVIDKVYPYAAPERATWLVTRHKLPQELGRRSAPFPEPRSSNAPATVPSTDNSTALASASNAGLNMNLLLANKQVYREASQILFSRNTFVMPTWAFMWQFFDIYAGKDQLNHIQEIELAFSLLEPYAAPGQLAIDRMQLSPQEQDILRVNFPQQRRRIMPPFAWVLKHNFNHLRPAGRQDMLAAWLQKVILAQSLKNCQKITLNLHEACHQFRRLDEYVLWPFMMPPNIMVKPSNWVPRLPDGMQVESLAEGLSLQTLLDNIQRYRLQAMPIVRTRPGA